MVATGQFGVNRICKLTGLSKATYYAARNPVDRLKEKYEHIKISVEKVIEAHPQYGIRRIKAELEDTHGVNVGRDTLGKLLKIWGLNLKRKVKRSKTNMIKKILIALSGRANLLVRTTINKAFQALTSDITELKFKGGKAYFCVHKDVFGQMVYGYDLSLNMKKKLVINSLNMAQKTIKKLTGRKLKDKPLLHQDQGSQFTSYSYVQKALKWTRLSYSDPGTPTHNPGQESFFGRFKDDWKEEIAEIQTFEKLEKFVKEKINYYNCERRHTSIGLVSPWNFTKSFLKKSN
jgi:transposase InsO family protein